jgi:hypothetical protein
MSTAARSSCVGEKKSHSYHVFSDII